VRQLQDIRLELKGMKRKRRLLVVSMQILQKQLKKCNLKQEHGKCKELKLELERHTKGFKEVDVQIARLKEECAIKTRETIIDLQQRLVPDIASASSLGDVATNDKEFEVAVSDEALERTIHLSESTKLDGDSMDAGSQAHSDIVSESESFGVDTKQIKTRDSTTAFTANLQRNDRSPASSATEFTRKTVTDEFDARWEVPVVNPFAKTRKKRAREWTAKKNVRIEQEHRALLFQRISKIKHLSAIAFSDDS